MGNREMLTAVAKRPVILLTSGLLLAFVAFLLRGPLQEAYFDFLAFIFDMQKSFHTSMTGSLKDLSTGGGSSAATGLIVGSFLYGVFHAAGPGHGKVILSTYLLTQPEKVGRSVMLAFASAIMQGITAIAIVYGLFYLFDIVARDSQIAVTWSERLAFALVIIVGCMLLLRGIRGLGLSRFILREDDAPHNNHSHGPIDHHHDHDHGKGESCEVCGHAHLPSARQMEEVRDWRSALGIVLSIGLRPCSGAVLVLVFARFTQIPLAGIGAVLAISIGTALTVAMLAVVSVKARDLAVQLSGGASSKTATYIANGAALLGGIVLIALGTGLLNASFEPVRRSMGL